MILRNEIFAHVLDWLVREKMVKDQQDLSMKTGISKNTISRIMTGKVEPKDDTLRKLNESFGNIFNMQYLRGRSTIMLIEDVKYYQQHPDEDNIREIDHFSQRLNESPSIAAEPNIRHQLPQWADTLIDIMSQQIKESEALNRELRHSIEEVNALRSNLQNLLNKIKKTP